MEEEQEKNQMDHIEEKIGNMQKLINTLPLKFRVKMEKVEEEMR